jgi:uncharacterized membrane protein YagU involved in acid resistance
MGQPTGLESRDFSGHAMLLTWVKLFHTVVFVVTFSAILFLLYCGLTNQLTLWTAVAFGLISIEVVIYAVNGFRSPLRTWAENLNPLTYVASGLLFLKVLFVNSIEFLPRTNQSYSDEDHPA